MQELTLFPLFPDPIPLRLFDDLPIDQDGAPDHQVANVPLSDGAL